ncbi:MAG: hypothetical protein PHD61_12400 [Bacteroidales bacterium]|nr:hypothetical protein [Lentimicrobiaceae bacterium]MDD5696089.1 hypothetical protein [Bacteroidales bacterium]
MSGVVQKAGLFADYHTLPGSNPEDKGRFEVTQAVDALKVPPMPCKVCHGVDPL